MPHTPHSCPLPPPAAIAAACRRGNSGSGVPRDPLVIASKWGIHMSGEGQFVTDGSRQHCR